MTRCSVENPRPEAQTARCLHGTLTYSCKIYLYHIRFKSEMREILRIFRSQEAQFRQTQATIDMIR